ncbi:baculoviral IAP repeat-containing protein 7-B-like isoform X2 [Ornithodoros turicata]
MSSQEAMSPDVRELLNSYDAAVWPRDLASELATHGFRSEGQGRAVRCVYCNGTMIVREDVGSQHLVIGHLREHPGCRQPVGSVPEEANQRDVELENKLNQLRPFFESKGVPWQLLKDAADIAKRGSAGVPSFADIMHNIVTLQKQTPEAQSRPQVPVSRPQPQQDPDVAEECTESLCKICYQEPVGVAFSPCSHVVCCVQCASLLRTCAVCRADITGFIRVVLS